MGMPDLVKKVKKIWQKLFGFNRPFFRLADENSLHFDHFPDCPDFRKSTEIFVPFLNNVTQSDGQTTMDYSTLAIKMINPCLSVYQNSTVVFFKFSLSH